MRRQSPHVLLAGAAAALLTAAVLLPAPTAAVAATDYPSWADVERARGDEAAKQAEIGNLEAALEALAIEVQRSEELAVTAEADYQDAYALAAATEDELNELSNALTAAIETAQTSREAAGTFVRGLSRTGLSEPSLLALAEPGETDEILFQLGALSRLGDHADEAMNAAQQDANAVDGLRAQADVAAAELERRRAAAEVVFQEAEAAFAAAQTALTEQQAQEQTLRDQLDFLTQVSATTAQEYQQGVEARRRAEEAERRAAAEAAARRAAEAAQRPQPAPAPAPSGGGSRPAPPPVSGSGSGTYFQASAEGWWRPVPGPVTSGYGPRRLICNSAGCSTPFHYGLDFGDPCGRPVRSIGAGTVTFVGPAGGFGNRVIVDHGGFSSIYGHLTSGSYKVSVGQQISAGTFVADVGNTGVGTGCHLDIKIQQNGNYTDPQAFLRALGVKV